VRQGTIAELTAGSDVVVVRTPTPDPLAAAVSSDGGTVGSGRCPVGESIRSTTATSPKAWPIATSRSVSTSGCASSRCAATRATTSRRRLTTDVLDRGLGSGHHDTEDHVERPRHPETRVRGSDHVDDTAGQLGDRHGEGRQVHLAAGVGGGPSGALPPARPRGRPQVRGARILYPLEEHRQLIACVQLQLVIGRLRLPRSLRSWCGSNQEGWQGGALPPGLCMIARRLMACQAREQVVR
jgi:hypothetical protein